MNVCPYCELRYNAMRTGYSYSDIYRMFWSGNDDSATWVNKRRRTILGRWHEIKLSMWNEHLDMCEREAEYVANLATQVCADALGDIYTLAHSTETGIAAVPF